MKTDDMEIAPDFFSYFEAAAGLLDRDKYVIQLKLICFVKSYFDSY